ncbi:transmembrane protein, putative (macronuclear) [Tetrahymena thermophila SB210]|uniref:Transmembrane protein, putative n=1 Tax=Tetrahymena thermophila (strain SB210) TaxID=312017 RepID=W7XC55_TETTS|nr:transmembrane protein, putative [Tetrahymena thermophila SB210]EWS74972.1 transmembrane protein, putative [Tetrahymena thermophila SB210]|eukprot:XP_012652513.1 transmembrane protein, putative [Tetrahymena thermophila SB210]
MHGVLSMMNLNIMVYFYKQKPSLSLIQSINYMCYVMSILRIFVKKYNLREVHLKLSIMEFTYILKSNRPYSPIPQQQMKESQSSFKIKKKGETSLNMLIQQRKSSNHLLKKEIWLQFMELTMQQFKMSSSALKNFAKKKKERGLKERGRKKKEGLSRKKKKLKDQEDKKRKKDSAQSKKSLKDSKESKKKKMKEDVKKKRNSVLSKLNTNKNSNNKNNNSTNNRSIKIKLIMKANIMTSTNKTNIELFNKIYKILNYIKSINQSYIHTDKQNDKQINKQLINITQIREFFKIVLYNSKQVIYLFICQNIKQIY